MSLVRFRAVISRVAFHVTLGCILVNSLDVSEADDFGVANASVNEGDATETRSEDDSANKQILFRVNRGPSPRPNVARLKKNSIGDSKKEVSTAPWLDAFAEIDKEVRPPTIQVGDGRYRTLPDYYWAANDELRERLDSVVAGHLKSNVAPVRGVTIVAGTAGVGKTFIKSGLFRDELDDGEVRKFDVRDWYVELHKMQLSEYAPDIELGDHAIGHLLGLTPAGRREFKKRLLQIQEPFLVIDSLDEVHPKDYLFLMRTIHHSVMKDQSRVKHAIIFGRPLVFRDYWHQCCSGQGTAGLRCFVLNAPELRTTGDLMVSSWNYHCWKYKLGWNEESHQQKHLSLEDYQRWSDMGFRLDEEFSGLVFKENRSLETTVQETLMQWASERPSVAAVLPNLAGNSMVREIVEETVVAGESYDENRFRAEFFAKWLERDTLSGDRPSRLKPQDLELYVRLLEEVAFKYGKEVALSKEGYFEVRDKDHVNVLHRGEVVSVSVQRLLNRSGLVNLDTQRPGDARYRFEPFWFQGWLMQMRNDRVDHGDSSEESNTIQSAKKTSPSQGSKANPIL